MTDCYYLSEHDQPCPNEAEHMLIIPTDSGRLPAIRLCTEHALQLLQVEVRVEEENEVQHGG